MITQPCPDIGPDVVPRYVAGTLEPEAVESFEVHMVDCAACQRALREAAALRKVLRTTASPVATPRSAPRRLRWIVPIAAAAAAAAVWLAWPRETSIESLGRLATAPALAVLPVRGDADSAALLVRRGVDAYLAGRYAEAARLFGASNAVSASTTAAFYRGVSSLLADDAAGAIAALGPLVRNPDNPYAAEARFYTAKAWLRRGRADSALAYLAAIPAGGALAAHAAALTDSVKAVTP